MKESSMVQMPESNATPTYENDSPPTLDPFFEVEKELTPEGLFSLAVWYQSCERVDRAIAIYQTAIHAAPRFAQAHYNLGCLHYHKNDWSNATRNFRKALDLRPDLIDAAYNLAMSLKAEEKYTQAAAAYQTTLELNPKLSNAHFCQGLCYLNTGDNNRAALSFRQTIALEPDNASAWFYLAAAILKTGSMDEILSCYCKCAELKPDWDVAHHNLAVALGKKQRLPEAIFHAHRTLELSPDFAPAREHLFRLAQHACDWQLTAKTAGQLDRLTYKELGKGIKTTESPMINIRRHSDPQLNLNVARSWSRHIAQEAAALPDRPIFQHLQKSSGRIRIGYLSSDFKDHAVAHQIRGMLAAHDRQRFEIFGYACNADDGTRYRQLLSRACDHFRELHGLSDVNAARLIHQDNIQILVDMAGHSRDNRMQIAALRPAPVQVSYLGFLSTTGADFIDYVTADAIVVPERHKIYYTEKVVYLPHCYQANDDSMPIADRKYLRSDFNLPDIGVVYTSFNLPYKIDAQLFNTWMAILKQVDDSVLWLIEQSRLARENLCRAAANAQVDPARLVFTGFVPIDHHLARLQLSDLALDTRIYNGGATTANALWAGVPVLALLGNHWVSRMSASALHAVGLPELVAPNLKEYERMAVDLGRNPHKLRSLREKLSQNRQKAPLFNTRLFARHMETAYATMWQRYCDGLQPASFEVQP